MMKRFFFQTLESIRMAWEQIFEYKLRSFLTALGVIMGIVAVSLMGASIQGIRKGVDDSLGSLGNDVFYVQKWPWILEDGDRSSFRKRPDIESHYADKINEMIAANPDTHLRVAVPIVDWFRPVHSSWETFESARVLGTSADFTELSELDLEAGRFFSESEADTGQAIVVLGAVAAEELFSSILPIGEEVRVGGQRFTVVGVLKRQDAMFEVSGLNEQVIMPLNTLRKLHRSNQWASVRIRIADSEKKEESREEIIEIMRRLRSLPPEEENNFELNITDIFAEKIKPMQQGIAMAGLFVTGLSLFVGAIGIMNITYVSVKERTREIGTRRALGATRSAILMQFIVESVSISLLGGFVGIAVTYCLTILVEQTYPDFPLYFSVKLVVVGSIVSLMTGVLSGVAPAYSASRLDPVLALRHE